MDILEFALEKEKISEESYRDLARRAENSGLKKIFIMLADEEAGHSRVIEEIIQDVSPALVQTQVLAKAEGRSGGFGLWPRLISHLPLVFRWGISSC
jgi:rubrerythrin